jgi:hypothetical protein
VRRTGIIFVAGLVLVAIAIAVTLSGSPVVVIHRNSNVAVGTFAETQSNAAACQDNEVLPGGTSMIRLSLTSDAGPNTSVSVLQDGHLLTSGSVGSGWTGGSVAVPVKAVDRTSEHVRVCFQLGPTTETVGIIGEHTGAAVAAFGKEGTTLAGRFRIEYLRRGSSSWWSEALMVARRMGLGRAPSGTWIVLPLLAVMCAVVAGASWLAVKELP